MGLPEPPELGASALPKGSFENQTVVVTGGGTGLGKAMAVEFARLGARIGILSRDDEHRRSVRQAERHSDHRQLLLRCVRHERHHILLRRYRERPVRQRERGQQPSRFDPTHQQREDTH